MDEFDISEADVLRVEALIDERFDESKIGTFVEPDLTRRTTHEIGG